MNYDGIEIFMMCIGNADCFLVIRYFPDGTKETVLIDGGNKSDAKDITERLHGLGVFHINHVVNTHPHGDHAGGLVELISNHAFTYDNLWVHQSWKYIDWLSIQTELGRNSAKMVLDRFNASLSIQIKLYNASVDRKIIPVEPFAGSQIGPFIVLSPTPDFYKNCLNRLSDTERIKQWDQYLQSQAEMSEFDRIIDEVMSDCNSLGEDTSPENESSVIMLAQHGDQKLLFCGDAGCDAFSDIVARRLASYLNNVTLMHAPHHGSRRNLWNDLVDYLNPQTVYISCKGSRKHPSKMLVNRLKTQCQAHVYASYYPKGSGFIWIRSAYGICPPRELLPVTPLYEAT